MNEAMGQILFGFAVIAASVEIFHIRRNMLFDAQLYGSHNAGEQDPNTESCDTISF